MIMSDLTFFEWTVAVAQNLLASFIGVLAGLAFAHFYRERQDRKRYGGWQVIVIKDGIEKVNREISVLKAKEIFQETAEKSVFLKGVASPYGWINNCDLIEEGEKIELLHEDHKQRRITINLDKNPPPERSPQPVRQPSNTELMEILQQIAEQLGLGLREATAGAPPLQKQAGGVEPVTSDAVQTREGTG